MFPVFCRRPQFPFIFTLPKVSEAEIPYVVLTDDQCLSQHLSIITPVSLTSNIEDHFTTVQSINATA